MTAHINRKSISDCLLKVLICSHNYNFETKIKIEVFTRLFEILRDSDLEV